MDKDKANELPENLNQPLEAVETDGQSKPWICGTWLIWKMDREIEEQKRLEQQKE